MPEIVKRTLCFVLILFVLLSTGIAFIAQAITEGDSVRGIIEISFTSFWLSEAWMSLLISLSMGLVFGFSNFIMERVGHFHVGYGGVGFLAIGSLFISVPLSLAMRGFALMKFALILAAAQISLWLVLLGFKVLFSTGSASSKN
ncbi:MAG: hypothetical protein EOP06_25275 [Proteobacteria bacterium]|nr:MAG: hypothetical protein EOP06_25275 [Pseudomonadota bacterium]